MKPTKYLFTLIFAFVCRNAFAQQQQDGYRIIHEIMDELVMETEDENKAEDLIESLFYCYENPIEINYATEEQLKQLIFLTDEQIHNILVYIKEKGGLLTIYELQLVEKIDETTIRRLNPFIIVSPVRSKFRSRIRNELLVRYDRTLEQKKGYANAGSGELYNGPPVKQLVKFKSSRANRYSAGFVMENDAGEALKWSPSDNHYGMDFLSGHLALEKRGIIDKIVIGDYQMNIGQGLTLSHAFSMGKSAEAVNIRKSSRGLKTYTGSHEYNFFRGIAATVTRKNISLTPFFSRKYLDARLNVNVESGNLYASSIINTGMHRTAKELAIRQKLSETVYGMDISYVSANRMFETGFTFLETRLGFPLQPNKSFYNQFAYRGSNLANTGAHVRYTRRNLNLFGELSAADLENFGGLAGMQAILTPNATMAFLYRNYGRSYHTSYGQAFGESSTNNEEGIYWGVKVNVNQKWKVDFYYDLFRFPWMRYQVYSASTLGREFLSRISYTPNRRSLLYVQYKTETKDKNAEPTGPIYQTAPMRKDQYLLNMDVNPANVVNMRFRAQCSFYDKKQGIALGQDLNLIFPKVRWYNRFALFDTDTYDNRQYMYEKDVLYAFTFPALHGRGTRYYSMLEFKATKNLSFWARIARTHYNDRESIGSGLEEIQGPKKTDLKLQARYVF
jgi:hypothetical protein